VPANPKSLIAGFLGAFTGSISLQIIYAVVDVSRINKLPIGLSLITIIGLILIVVIIKYTPRRTWAHFLHASRSGYATQRAVVYQFEMRRKKLALT
jgi:hypothetical protein